MKKVLVLVVLLSFSLSAQQSQTAQTLPDKPEPQKKRRILGLIPASNVTDADAPHVPLSSREKLNMWADGTFDRWTLISAGFDAGINQATDTPHGYGQGAEGFAKRYGAAVADKVASDFMKEFAFPVIFRQDPRYFRKATGSGGSRTGYAISRVFVARSDSGKRMFNVSEVLGCFASAALVNAWYPDEDRDMRNTLVRGGGRLGVSMGLNILKEFMPEVTRKIGIGQK